jgi:hypothetical protein
MKAFQKFILIASIVIATASFAGHINNKTLQLTLINNTDTPLTYTGATGQNPGNVFSINQATIPAHAEALITGMITSDMDLAAALHFSDSNGHDNMLVVIDPRNFHIMQSLFRMRNDYLYSVLKSEKTGDNSDARALHIASATVEIENVPSFFPYRK